MHSETPRFVGHMVLTQDMTATWIATLYRILPPIERDGVEARHTEIMPVVRKIEQIGVLPSEPIA
jgi:hypothetical protein